MRLWRMEASDVHDIESMSLSYVCTTKTVYLFQSILSRAFCHFSSRWYPVQPKDRRTVTPFKSPLDRWSFRSFLLWDMKPWLGHLRPSGSVLSKTAIFPKKQGRKREISRANESARGWSLREANVTSLGERQRRTAWWARHSKDTANDHLVETCLY